MIPEGQYNPALVEALVRRLRVEINDVRAARSGLDAHWTKLMKAYRHLPAQEKKTFPYEGCANLVVPVVATDVDKVYAWIMALLFGQENLWSVKPLRPDMVLEAPRMQEFLQWAQHNELGAYDAVADFVKELVLLGTGVLKTRYVRNEQKVYEYRETASPTGEVSIFERQSKIMLHDHPILEHVALWDMYFHPQATSIKDSEWVAQRVMLSWETYQERVRMGVYADGGRITQSWAREYSPPVVRALEALDKFRPYRGERLELFECWLKADITGDGDPCALVLTIHEPTNTLVRLDYNPYFSQEPPYDISRFVRQPKRLYGIGIGDMLVNAQEEVSTMHNQRIDAATVRTMPLFWALKDGEIGVNEALFPGRILHVARPDEFGAIPLATGALESTVDDEQLALAYHRERTGINDFVMGGDGPDVSYAAASTAASQLREGKKRFDQTMREIRTALSGAGTRILELYQQFSQGQKVYLAMGETDGALVQKVLNFPLDIIRAGVIVDVTATSAALNKEVEVRTNTLIMQLLQRHNQETLSLFMQLFNPQVPEPMRAVIVQQLRASTTMMRRILDAYGIQDAEALVVDYGQLLGGGNGPAPFAGPQGPGMGGGFGVLAGASGIPMLSGGVAPPAFGGPQGM
jgi:hypothetical protein